MLICAAIVICPLEADATTIFLLAAMYDSPVVKRVIEPDNPDTVEITTCPLDEETIDIFCPAARYDCPVTSCVSDPDNPESNEPNPAALTFPVKRDPESVAMTLSLNDITTALPEPPSVMSIPILDVKTRSFASDDVEARTTYAALGSPPPDAAEPDTTICPLDKETIVMFGPATIKLRPLFVRWIDPAISPPLRPLALIFTTSPLMSFFTRNGDESASRFVTNLHDHQCTLESINESHSHKYHSISITMRLTVKKLRSLIESSLDVPDTRQETEWTCGPASLRAVMKALKGIDIPEDELVDLSDADSEEGSSTGDMMKALERLNVKGKRYDTIDSEMIKKSLSQGNPVILDVDAWGGEHWVVAKGSSGDTFILMDPSAGELRLSSKALDSIRWSSSNGRVRGGIIIGSS